MSSEWGLVTGYEEDPEKMTDVAWIRRLEAPLDAAGDGVGDLLPAFRSWESNGNWGMSLGTPLDAAGDGRRWTPPVLGVDICFPFLGVDIFFLLLRFGVEKRMRRERRAFMFFECLGSKLWIR